MIDIDELIRIRKRLMNAGDDLDALGHNDLANDAWYLADDIQALIDSDDDD